MLIASMLLSGSITGFAAPDPPPPKTVDLKGAQIPDHWVWRTLFNHLAMATTKNLERILNSLALPDDELLMVMREAKQQPARDANCQGEMADRAKPLIAAGAKPAALEAARHDVMVGCRQRVLDARDRVLGSLPEKSQKILHVWVNDKRKRMTVAVVQAEMAKFMTP